MGDWLLDLFGIRVTVITVEEACEELASRRVTVSLTFKPVVVELTPTGPQPGAETPG